MASSPPLYSLLPELYRNRDAAAGFALRALTEILDGPRGRIEADIEALYRDWFVETCADPALPYLAALAGRQEPPSLAFDRRALVADAVAFARRKGSYCALEHELAKLTGWPIQIVVEGGQAVVRYWEEPVYTLRDVATSGEDPRRYRFHPLGVDCRLFAAPRPYAGIEARFEAGLHAPVALTRDSGTGLLARALGIVIEHEDGEAEPVSPEEMGLADLGAWEVPSQRGKRVWIDPVLGRFLLKEAPPPRGNISACFSYAAAGNVGGGPYERETTRADDKSWIAYVHRAATPGATAFRTLQEALEAYRKVPGAGLIRILDSGAYDLADHAVGAAPLVCPDDPDAPRRLTIEALSGETPTLRGTFRFTGAAAGLDLALRGLWIDGRIEIDGAVDARIEHCTVQPVSGRRAAAADAEPAVALIATAREGATPRLALHACLMGPLALAGGMPLTISDSAVDGYGVGPAIIGGPRVRMARCTLLGGADLGGVEAVDSILGAALRLDSEAARIDYCFVPQGAAVPPGFGNISGAAGPLFGSSVFASPGYARLDTFADAAVRTGASNGSAMGLFNGIHAAQRLDLMRQRLRETLPIGIGYALEPQSLTRPHLRRSDAKRRR